MEKSETEKNDNRFDHIDVIKGFAIILVVLGHEIDYLTAGGIVEKLSHNMYTLSQCIALTHMPIFFLCSGLFADRFEKRNVKINVENILLGFMVPYFLQIILLTFVNQIFSGILGTKADWHRVLKSIVEPFGQYWFLYAMFVIQIIYCLATYLLKMRKVRYIVMMTIGIALYIIQMSNTISYTLLQKVMKYFLFYMLGVLLTDYICNALKNIKFFVIAAIILLIISLNDITNIYSDITNISYSLLFIDLMLIVISIYCKYIPKSLGIIKFCGTHSMEVYSIHPYINMVIRIVMGLIWIGDRYFSRVVISTVVIVSICCLIIKFIPKDWFGVKAFFGKLKVRT